MIASVLAMMMFGALQSAPTAPADPSWCHHPDSPTPDSPTNVIEDEAARFSPVRPEAVEEALEILAGSEAVSLSDAALRRFADRQADVGVVRYYLVRGAVFAPPGSDLRRSAELASTAHYQLYFTPDRMAVIVASQPAMASQVAPQNLPLILASSAEIDRLVVACYYIP